MEFRHNFNIHNSSKHAKSILAAESKACNLQECKGKGLENSTTIGDTDVFPVVRIGGAILHQSLMMGHL